MPILAILKLLPVLLYLLKDLIDLAKKISEDKPEDFIKDSRDAFKQLKEAKTPDEKVAAAQNIQNLLAKL